MNAEKRTGRIWRWFKRRPSTCLRNALVQEYWGLLAHEAAKLHARLPASVELDDLMADGALGLLDAISAFNPSRSKFQTFSRRRIWGAMVDGLRSRDPVSRNSRQKMRQLEKAALEIRSVTGIAPTPQEVSQRLGISLKDYSKCELEAREAVTRPIAGGRLGAEEYFGGEVSAETLADRNQEDPTRPLLRAAVRDTITSGFSRSERLIVVLYYYEAMNMKEIGATLDLSESRVSQIHSSILARMRAKLRENELMV